MYRTAAFERCSPGARAVLSIAAVCGQEFDLATVQHAAAMPPTRVSPAEVLASVGELENLGLVAPVQRSTTRYRIADVEVLLSALGVAARTEIHLRVAESLQRSGGSIGHIADHLAAALPLAPAARVIAAAQLAADHAEGRRAYAEAVRFNQVALDAVPFQAAPDPAERAELLVRLGEAQMRSGNRAAALDSFESAIAIDSPQRPELAVRAALAYSSWPSVPVRDTADAGLRALIEHALGLAGQVESGSRAMLMARLAQSYRWSVDADRAWALLDDAERLAVAVDDQESLSSVLLARRLLTAGPDADVERLELSGRVWGAIGDASLDRPLALLLHFADQLSAGNLAAATAQVARLTDAADERESSGSRYFALRSGAAMALLSGHLDRAERLAADALVYGRRAEHPRVEVGFHLQQLHVAAMRGGLDRSIVLWRDLGVTSALATGVLAWAEALGGSADAARAAVNDVWAFDLSALALDAAWLPTVSMVADAVVTLGMSDHVAELRAVIEPHAHRIPTIYTGIVCLGSMHRVAGRLATAARDWDAAETHLLTAITANDRLGAVLLAASSRTDYAVMLQRRGFHQDGARIAGLLDHALAACRSRHAAGLAERIDRVRATADDRQPDAPAESSDQPVLDGLSPREIDVISRIARGMSNKAIAADLYISAATVQRHTINLYRKIGANGRSDAAVYAARHRLIDSD